MRPPTRLLLPWHIVLSSRPRAWAPDCHGGRLRAAKCRRRCRHIFRAASGPIACSASLSSEHRPARTNTCADCTRCVAEATLPALARGVAPPPRRLRFRRKALQPHPHSPAAVLVLAGDLVYFSSWPCRAPNGTKISMRDKVRIASFTAAGLHARAAWACVIERLPVRSYVLRATWPGGGLTKCLRHATRAECRLGANQAWRGSRIYVGRAAARLRSPDTSVRSLQGAALGVACICRRCLIYCARASTQQALVLARPLC